MEKNKLLIIGMITCLLLIIGVTGTLWIKNTKGSVPNSQSLPSLTKSPNVSDKKSDWKEFNSGKISFKHPSTYVVKMSDQDYFNIATTKGNFISIDARNPGNYANFDQAVDGVKSGLINIKTESMSNGIKISGIVGPGFGEGKNVTLVILKGEQDIAIIETIATDQETLKVFDQIVASFKFS